MPRTGRPPIFDDVKQQNFLQLLGQGLTIREAARQVGVSPSTDFDKKKVSPAFAAACAEAKAQALPALLEHIHAAGARSWRASAWLLERIRPDLFGRRVALGLDPARPKPPKRLPKSVMTDEMITDFIDSLRLVPEAQAFAKQKLAELEDQQRAWDAARAAYDEEIDRLGRPRDFNPSTTFPYPVVSPRPPSLTARRSLPAPSLYNEHPRPSRLPTKSIPCRSPTTPIIPHRSKRRNPNRRNQNRQPTILKTPTFRSFDPLVCFPNMHQKVRPFCREVAAHRNDSRAPLY